jgi:DNA-binding NarL/FixJ family response regulator
MKTRLVLVEDHQIVRQGLRAVLGGVPEFDVVGEAADGLAALKVIESLTPDVVVLDLMIPSLSGLEVARSVTQRFDKLAVVILSMHSDVAYVNESFKAGALGYVLKAQNADELILAIRRAAVGSRYLSPAISEEELNAYAERSGEGVADAMNSLTLREREVLQMTAEGLSGAEIGRRLFISPRTVETHRANVMRKLGIRNQKEMVRYAVERGLIADHARVPESL